MTNVRSRVGLGVISQVLSSITNFLAGLVAVRGLAPRAFGFFAVAGAVSALAVGAVRALSGEALVLSSPTPQSAARRAQGAVRRALRVSLIVSAVLAVTVWALGDRIDGDLQRVLWIVAAVLPGLSLFDVGRYIAVASATSHHAAALDAAWLAGLIGAYAAGVRPGSAAAATLLWLAPGSLLGWINVLVLRSAKVAEPLPLGDRLTAVSLLAEWLASNGLAQVGALAVGAVGGATLLGEIRASQLAFGPITLLLLGANFALLPEAVRAAQERRTLKASGTAENGSTAWSAVRFSAVGLAIVGLWTVLLHVLPTRAGRIVFGTSWDSVRSLALLMGVVVALSVIATVGSIRYRASLRLRRAVLARVATGVATLVLSTVASLSGSARVVVAGMAVGRSITLPLWLRRADPDPDDDTARGIPAGTTSEQGSS